MNKTDLEAFWFKDESPEDVENLHDPDNPARNIAENLENSLKLFRSILEIFGKIWGKNKKNGKSEGHVNNMVDIWIFYSQSDEAFGSVLTEQLRKDFKEKAICTSGDLKDTVTHLSDFKIKDITIIILPVRNVTSSWFIAEQANARFNYIKKVLTIQYKPDTEIPNWLSRFNHHNFTDQNKFNLNYKKLFDEIRAFL